LINLRYHIVSLVAVFLAVGIGIVMGTTVVDKVTVEALNRRLDTVERDVISARDENRQLADRVRLGSDYADQARDFVLDGQLGGVPVLVLAVTGVDRRGVDALGGALAGSGATVQGSVWFTPRMRLDNDADRRALAALVGPPATVPTTAGPETAPATTAAPSADDVRAAALRGVTTPGRLAALVAAGFAVYEAPGPGPSTQGTRAVVELASIPLADTRYALVSGAGAEVGDDLLALPLAAALAEGAPRVVAVEAGQDAPGGRGVFVGLLRGDATLGPRLSTIDNVESSMGQAAAVLALEQLGLPRLGHFGVGPGAERLLPQPVPEPVP